MRSGLHNRPDWESKSESNPALTRNPGEIYREVKGRVEAATVAIPLHFVDDTGEFVTRRINFFGGRDNGRNDRLDAINYNGPHQMAAVNETCMAQMIEHAKHRVPK